MSGVIQASTNATSGANAANQSGPQLPPWAIVAIAAAVVFALVKIAR